MSRRATTIDLYFWGPAVDDGEGDGPVHSIVHVHKQAHRAGQDIAWPSDAVAVEIVAPGLGLVQLRNQPSPGAADVQ